MRDMLTLLIYLLSLRLDDNPRATSVTQAHSTSSMLATPVLLARSDQHDAHQAKVHSHGKQSFPSRKTRKWRGKRAIFQKFIPWLCKRGRKMKPSACGKPHESLRY